MDEFINLRKLPFIVAEFDWQKEAEDAQYGYSRNPKYFDFPF
jgi:hypothetical protein